MIKMDMKFFKIASICLVAVVGISYQVYMRYIKKPITFEPTEQVIKKNKRVSSFVA